MSYSPKHPAHSAPARAKSTKKKPASNTKKTQKILIIAIVAVLVLIVAAALIFILIPGAENGFESLFTGSSKKYVPETQDGTTIISQYYENGILPTSGERHDVEVINGGGANASDLEGVWSVDDVTIYEFDGRGRGIMLTGVKNYTFVYSAENGTLLIDYDIDGAWDREYAYTISGDQLSMSREGQVFNLTKKD